VAQQHEAGRRPPVPRQRRRHRLASLGLLEVQPAVGKALESLVGHASSSSTSSAGASSTRTRLKS
jgi:hypothetical protein